VRQATPKLKSDSDPKLRAKLDAQKAKRAAKNATVLVWSASSRKLVNAKRSAHSKKISKDGAFDAWVAVREEVRTQHNFGMTPCGGKSKRGQEFKELVEQRWKEYTSTS
jgi:hypothetical protein